MSLKGTLLGMWGSIHASKHPENYLVKVPNLGTAVRDLRHRSKCRVIKQYEVKPDGSKDYTTISAAIAAAVSFQTAQMAAEGCTLRTPNYTVEILVHPGTYTVTTPIVLQPFVPVISATGVAGDVVVRSLTMLGTDLGTLISNSDFYIEGLDIVRAGTVPGTSGKYCHHIALSDYQTGIAVNCRFYTETSNTDGGWTTVGMDGSPGMALLYYGCEFWQKSSGTYAKGTTNLHGLIAGAPAGAQPSNVLFINSTAGAVGYNALSNLVADDIWVSGGSYTSVTAEGALTDLHHSFATGTMSAQGSVIANLSGMPTILGGMSPRELTRYFGTPA